jgi:hypothetical protein
VGSFKHFWSSIKKTSLREMPPRRECKQISERLNLWLFHDHFVDQKVSLYNVLRQAFSPCYLLAGFKPSTTRWWGKHSTKVLPLLINKQYYCLRAPWHSTYKAYMTLRINTYHNSGLPLWWVTHLNYFYAERRYAEYCYAECHYDECHGTLYKPHLHSQSFLVKCL